MRRSGREVWREWAGAAASPQGMVVAGGVFAIGTIGFFRVPLLASIGRDLSMSPGELGLITTAFAVGRLAIDIPAGWITDRYATGRVMAVAALAVAMGSLLFAWSTMPIWAWGASVLLGVASAMANTAGMSYFSGAAPAARRGASLAMFSVALLIGHAIGPTLAGLLASLGTWRTSLIVGGLGLVVAVIMLRRGALPGPRPDRRTRAEAKLDAPRREIVVLYAVSFVMFFALGSIPQTLIPISGGDELGLGAGAIGLALGVGGAFQLVGAIVGGQITDRVSRKGGLVPALALQAAGIALLVNGRNLAFWLAAIIVTSLTTFALSAGATMLGDRAPEGAVGRAFGTFRFVGDVGLIAGPAIVTQLYERVGQTAAVLMVAGVVGICALASALVLSERPSLRAGT